MTGILPTKRRFYHFKEKCATKCTMYDLYDQKQRQYIGVYV